MTSESPRFFSEEDVREIGFAQNSVRIWLPDQHDHIQKTVRTSRKFYEPDLLAESFEKVNPGDLVIDVGANIGNHTLFWAGICKADVIAVEPNRSALEILNKNLALNGLEDSVSVIDCAVSSRYGQGELIENQVDNMGTAALRSNSAGSIRVDTLDSIVPEASVSLVKVDTEGHDLDVLKGSAGLLSRARPLIYCEAENDEARVLIDQYLGSLGYRRVIRYCHTPTHLYTPSDDVPSQAQQLRLSTDEIGAAISRTEEAVRADLRRTKFSSEAFHGELKALVSSLTKGQSALVSENRAQLQVMQAEVERLRLLGERQWLDHIQAERQRAQQKIEALSREWQVASGNFEQKVAELESELEKSMAAREKLSDTVDANSREMARLRAEAQIGAQSAEQKSREVRLLRESVSYRLGNALVELVADPRAGFARFPARILGLFSNQKSRVKGSQNRSVDFKMTPAAAAPVDHVASVQQYLPQGRFQTGKLVFEDNLTSGFGPWLPNQDVKLGAEGKVAINQGVSTPGILRKCDVKEGRFYRLQIHSLTSPAHGQLCIGVTSETHDQVLTPFYPVKDTSGTSVVFRVPSGCHTVRLAVVVQDPSEGDYFAIRRVELSEQSDMWEKSGPKRPHLAYRTIAGLASIPSRAQSLSDVVASLSPQVDEIRIFLNGYASVPEWLNDKPRVKVFRSQDFADYGDAGKFFKIDPQNPEYYFTCDDDILYPVDYVDSMLSELLIRRDQAVVGVHGVLIKQPLTRYYDDSSRYVFRHVNGLTYANSVHVLGTGTTAFRSDILGMRFRDLQAPNMADIWLAARAHHQRIPLVAVPRLPGWMTQSPHASAAESIYGASKTGANTAMDSGNVQTFVFRQLAPVTRYPDPVLQSPLKAVLGITTFNRKNYLEKCIQSFIETRDPSLCWTLIVADDGSTDGTLEYLESLRLPVELHIIRNQRRYAVGQTNEIFDLATTINFDVGFKADDDVVFEQPGWASLYLDGMRESEFDHLCYLNEQHFLELRLKDDPEFSADPVKHSSGKLVSHGSVEKCMGAFFTFTPRMLAKVGYGDEINFPIRGQWHIDLSARACRAGLNESQNFYDVIGSNQYISLQNNIDEAYRCSIPWSEYGEKVANAEELTRRAALIRDSNRVKIPREKAVSGAKAESVPPPRVEFNQVFDRVFVLNLARRPDRLESFACRARLAEIEFERFEAVDGSTEPYRRAWKSYSKGPLQPVPNRANPVTSSREYYLDYNSQAARLAFLEHKLGRKAIQTPGAWGYLETMKALIEKAILEEYESIVVFDDDAIFHRRFPERFSNIYKKIPKSWKIIQLGTLQYHWSDNWVEWCSEDLYRDYGTGLGSHAVAIRSCVFPMLLDHCRRFLLPYDEGALHYVRRTWPEDCYTVYPNLVIQDVGESDINSSVTQAAEGSSLENRYRWNLPDYAFERAEGG